MDGVTYTWDNNSNLLSDGTNAYTYDHANRLISVVGSATTSSFGYRCNGLSSDPWGIIGCQSDRVSQTVDGMTESYTLDLNNWLTQVLADGTNTYLYGTGRIAQYDVGGAEYFLGDALGSVRQLTDTAGDVTLAKSYQPFGNVMQSAGTGSSSYGFTNEWIDGNGLIYLRARYYEPGIGRFISKDEFPGDKTNPLSYNAYLYGQDNPIIYTDPSGWCIQGDKGCLDAAQRLYVKFGWYIKGTWSFSEVNKLTEAAGKIAAWLNRHGGNGEARMRAIMAPAWFNHANIIWEDILKSHHVWGYDVYLLSQFTKGGVIHEMAHILDNHMGSTSSASIIGGGPSDEMVKSLGVDPSACPIRFLCKPKYEDMLKEASAELQFEEYGLSGPSEDFGETFRVAVTDERKLLDKIPMRAKWLLQYIQKLTSTKPEFKGQPYKHRYPTPNPQPLPPCSPPQY